MVAVSQFRPKIDSQKRVSYIAFSFSPSLYLWGSILTILDGDSAVRRRLNDTVMQERTLYGKGGLVTTFLGGNLE